MNYLKHRTSTTQLNGLARKISIKTGCPQGGILSVLLWNICFDMLLSKFTKGRVRCIGFADDGTLIIYGKDLKNMRNQMQKAIHKVDKWAKECGLSLSPQKTHAVLFTHKRKIPDIDISLKIGDTQIDYVDTVKCLGITFDNKLTWNAHQ